MSVCLSVYLCVCVCVFVCGVAGVYNSLYMSNKITYQTGKKFLLSIWFLFQHESSPLPTPWRKFTGHDRILPPSPHTLVNIWILYDFFRASCLERIEYRIPSPLRLVSSSHPPPLSSAFMLCYAMLCTVCTVHTFIFSKVSLFQKKKKKKRVSQKRSLLLNK